uniref:Uncharacterized protein n=1 Tax=Rhizophora mucronata TaxID=61149 RepID=A0A2P2QVC3_RHIMU
MGTLSLYQHSKICSVSVDSQCGCSSC